MTWEPNLEGSTGPMFERIANAMVADIRNGTLQPGDRLPGHRELAAKLGITVSTVSRAFREVIQQKLIDAGTRRGTHVRADIGAGDVEQGSVGCAKEPRTPAGRSICAATGRRWRHGPPHYNAR